MIPLLFLLAIQILILFLTPSACANPYLSSCTPDQSDKNDPCSHSCLKTSTGIISILWISFAVYIVRQGLRSDDEREEKEAKFEQTGNKNKLLQYNSIV